VRVLYVQRPTGGGSMTGLIDMLRSLDRSVFEPMVLFSAPNDYTRTMRELDVPVRILDPHAPPSPLPSSVRRTVAPLRTFTGLRELNRLARRDRPRIRRIARLLREEPVDLVHHNDHPRADRASIIAARLAGLRQVCHVRNLPDYYPPIDRRLSAWVSHYIYMSDAIEEACRAALRIPREKGSTVYDGFDMADLLAAGEADGAAVRAELGLPENAPVITNIGRIVPWKGHDVFLDAMAEVHRTHEDARALIVGAPPPDQKGADYLRLLRDQAARLGLDGRAVFAGFRADVHRVLAASDVVVHSASRPEPFGRIVVEAMAAARPVVATGAGGVLEIVTDQVSGLLVPPNDAPAMAGAIRRLLSSPAEARAMGQHAREEARRRFTRERFGQELSEVYRRVLGPAPRSPGER
jgi:glycosyltransferase involved in cell wall biosynthesis